MRGRYLKLTMEQQEWLRANWHLPIAELRVHLKLSAATLWVYARRLDLPSRPMPGRPTKPYIPPPVEDPDGTDRPVCVCGARTTFETWDGYVSEVCRSCGLGKKVPTRGTRKYDQRERLEQFLAEYDQRSAAIKPRSMKRGSKMPYRVGKYDPDRAA